MLEDDEEWHSLHPQPLTEDCRSIDWSLEVPRADRVRVRSYTCSCMPVFYELCQAAGLMFIRRLSRGGDVTVVHESPWMRCAEVEGLWERLLRGEAR
ncbi:hypothetical protein ACFSKW_46810 [Nonomuraea mangrovi]|uniref:Uncharacterized protein n=1 Tax=Nonomuraea mangrovi TaxID=2316207 RepID=A0ABW4TCD1_9ACTN